MHWRAWGEAALAEARESGKPILLSVGYAACHWCHVMAHESFEDAATAAVMNELFVNIKVDREERPDVDPIYMARAARRSASRAAGRSPCSSRRTASRSGAAPISRKDRAMAGRPSSDVLNEIARIYRDERDKVATRTPTLLKDAAQAAPPRRGRRAAERGDARRSRASACVQAVDPVHGGIRGAPKFPQAQFFELLWRAGLRIGDSPIRSRRSTSPSTHIAQGGIYDHLGGGFARYSRRRALARAAFREDALRQRPADRADDRGVARARSRRSTPQRIEETIDWLLREMT